MDYLLSMWGKTMIPKQLQRVEYRFVPIMNGEKRPVGTDWQTTNNYSYEQIEDVMKKNNSEAYGVVCGFDGLYVLDIDNQELQTRIHNLLPTTFTVRSGGKGLNHYYFTNEGVPTPFKITEKQQEKEITLADVQGVGKQVIGPGSKHCQTGNIYEIINDVSIAKFNITELKKILGLQKQKEQEQRKVVKQINCTFHNDHDPSLTIYADKTFYCFGCRRYGFQEVLYHDKKAIKEQETANGIFCYIYEKELEWYKSILQKPENRLEERSINLVNGEELLQKNLPEPEWVVDEIICKPGITILGGDTATFKSYVALHLSCTAVTANQFLSSIRTRKMKVLYIDEEMGERTIKTRLRQFKEGLKTNSSFTDLHIASFNNFKLDNAEQIKKLVALIERTRPDLIIIDSMVRFLTGDENSAKDVKATFDSMKMLMHDYGVSFLILHHTRKSGSDKKHDLRGSGDFSAYADNVFMISSVSKADQEYEITQVKSRHLPGEPTYKFKVFDDEGMRLVLINKYGKKETPRAKDRCAQDLLNWIREENRGQFETAEVLTAMTKIGHASNAIYDALSELIKMNELEKSKWGKYIRSEREVPIHLE